MKRRGKQRAIKSVPSVSQTRKRIARLKQKNPPLYLVITLIVLLVVAMPALYILPQLMQIRDLEGAVPQHRMGVVTQIISPGRSNRWGVISPEVMVRFDDEEAHAIALTGVNRRLIGRSARITYRVGKRGLIYIDRIEPQ